MITLPFLSFVLMFCLMTCQWHGQISTNGGPRWGKDLFCGWTTPQVYCQTRLIDYVLNIIRNIFKRAGQPGGVGGQGSDR